MPELCLFCDNKSGSREHLWPKWIHERKDFGPLRLQLGTSPEKAVPDPEQKVKTVCSICNNGWMSDLEAENIPIIGCMFQDLSTPLDEAQQHSVAAWAVKTAMISDSTKGRNAPNRFYNKVECVNLRVNRTITNRTRIWIGRMSESHLGVFGTDFTILSAGTRIGMGSAATIVMGHFAVQVVTLHINPENPANDFPIQPKPGNWDNMLIRIWPKERETVTWPPNVSFTNGGPLGIAYLIDRWRVGSRLDIINKH